jgi:DNA topoisomerase-1
MVIWGFAVRTDECCPVHQLHHVRLVKKGARPWDIGCPLCHHIASNRETLMLMPSMTEPLHTLLNSFHLYSVFDLVKAGPESLAKMLNISDEKAAGLFAEAEDVLALLRKRSDCRKFVRKHLTPRRGRSPAKVMKKLHESGIDDLSDLAKADLKTLQEAGMGEGEAGELKRQAKMIANGRLFREIGIPAVSLKKYQEAEMDSPDDFLAIHPAAISHRTGLSPETVCMEPGTGARMSCPEKGTKTSLKKSQAPESSVWG